MRPERFSLLDDRRHAVQHFDGTNIDDQSYGQFLNRSWCLTPGHALYERKLHIKCAALASTYQFLNGGWVMGPIGELQKVMSALLRLPKNETNNWNVCECG